MYDVAYFSSSGNLLSATQTPQYGVRGLANGYLIPVTATLGIANATVPVKPSLVTLYTCMTSTDSMSGLDVPTVRDPNGTTKYTLQGCFGCTEQVSLTITNHDPSYAHTIVISGGSGTTAGSRFAYVYGSQPGGCSGTTVTPGQWLNLITDTLGPGAQVTYNFNHMDAGGFNAPLAIGVTVTS